VVVGGRLLPVLLGVEDVGGGAAVYHLEKGCQVVKTSVARWSKPTSTDESGGKAPFTVILAIVNQ
jgi:hypothetical protein